MAGWRCSIYRRAPDLILAGPRESAPLLLVLAVLSVFGVLAGVLLRIRAYLFLGSGFLILVVLRMIWHAAVEREQTWIWWACGILLGIVVLAVFALLERRGQQLREALEKFQALAVDTSQECRRTGPPSPSIC